MTRRILVLVCGLCACGDNNNKLIDAGPTSIDAPVTLPIDGSIGGPPIDAAPTGIPGLILAYDFEDSATGTAVADTSGKGFNGTLSDMTAWAPTGGRNGQGLALQPVQPVQANGALTPQFVSLPSGIFTGVGDFTISTWINVVSNDNFARIYDLGSDFSHFMFLTVAGFVPGQPTPDGVHATSFEQANGGDNFVGSNTQLPLGVWKHVAITGHGGNREMFIDGFPAAISLNGIDNPPSQMEPLGGQSWIGRSRFTGNPPPPPDPGLNASLDEFHIYNRVLTASEIEDLASPKKDYAYWRFDDGTGATAKESSDNRIPTVLMNGAAFTTAGRLGGAVNLTGGAATTASPYVSMAANPLASCTNTFTLAAWVNLRTSDVHAQIFNFSFDMSTFMFLTENNGVGLSLGMGKANMPAFNLTAPAPVPADNAWHHVAVTMDATGLVTLFMDGSSVASDTNTIRMPSEYATAPNSWIGRSGFTQFDPFVNGLIDEVRISCRAFTADEIKSLAFSGG